jgi:hypothetical protein
MEVITRITKRSSGLKEFFIFWEESSWEFMVSFGFGGSNMHGFPQG